MLVRIIKWDYPGLQKQTPAGALIWDGITFTEEPVERCDHVLVLNYATERTRVICSPDRVWALIGEPPTDFRHSLHRALPVYARTYMQDPRQHGARYVHSHGGLPWRVNKSYDELVAMTPPDKPRALSWITSDVVILRGHVERLAFLERL